MKKLDRKPFTGKALIFLRKSSMLNNAESYDAINLIHNARFEVFISHNLYWVPVNELGSTEYTNDEIERFIGYTPEQKRNVIRNVYEAIQLLQVGRFEEVIDVLRLDYNGVTWEHHKPGCHAVLTNRGCCSSIASWVNYLVGDKYPIRGYFGYTRPDASGHIFNYFFHNDFYYLVDANAMLYNYAPKCCKETGIKKDFLNASYITGCCYKTNDLYSFVKYYSRILKFKGFDFLYYTLPPDEYVPPSSSKILDSGVVKIASSRADVLNEVEKIKFVYEDGPNYSPNWNWYDDKP
jgi:hypothetical protein